MNILLMVTVSEEWNANCLSAAAGGYLNNYFRLQQLLSTGTENTDLLVQCNNSNFDKEEMI